MEVQTRWMLRADVPAVAAMMRASGEGETEKSLDRMFKRSSVVCTVAEIEGKVVGFMSYDVGRVSKIKMVSFFVDEGHRRNGVGTKMISTLTSKLGGKRNRVELSVSEYNLPAQLFLRSAGFRAEAVDKDDAGKSEYSFVYRLSEEPERV